MQQGQNTATITHPMTENPNRDLIDGLRALADHLEATPGLRVNPMATVSVLLSYKDEEVSETVRLMGGERSKRPMADEGFMLIARDFGGNVVLKLIADREQVCTKRVVGTETVEVPDPTALALVPTITQEREIVEWDCDPVLAPEVGF